MSQSVSLLIPTMNRSDFIVRLLNYYNNTGFQGCILIGDSSNPAHLERTKSAIQSLRGRLEVVYQEYPGLNAAECFHNLTNLVDTPYVAYVADDDFLTPSAIAQCEKFLYHNPDYSAAHGLAVILNLETGGAHGLVTDAWYYPQPQIEGTSAVQRLLYHLGSYSVVQFSVHRSKIWKTMFRDVNLPDDLSFGSELLPCCLSVVLGKVKELDCLYLVRQVHDRRFLWPDVFDWITSERWQPLYLIFRDQLVEALVRQDGITTDEARAVVKQAFWSYLIRQSSMEWQSRYGQADGISLSRWRQIARAIPGARRTWRLLRSLKSKEHDKFSLLALLNPSSPYHADFMPIYRAITTPPSDTDLRMTVGTERNM